MNSPLINPEGTINFDIELLKKRFFVRQMYLDPNLHYIRVNLSLFLDVVLTCHCKCSVMNRISFCVIRYTFSDLSLPMYDISEILR